MSTNIKKNSSEFITTILLLYYYRIEFIVYYNYNYKPRTCHNNLTQTSHQSQLNPSLLTTYPKPVTSSYGRVSPLVELTVPGGICIRTYIPYIYVKI